MFYRTISDSSIVSFEEKVQRSLCEGWVLHGDLFVHRDMFNQTMLFRPSIFKKKIKKYDVVIGATPVDLDNWVSIFIEHGRKPYGSVIKDMDGNLAQVLIK